MVKRFSAEHLIKRYSILVFALIFLIVSWESNKTNAAVVDPMIPKEAIRLRILGNSDSIEDQAMKRKVREAVEKQMAAWTNDPKGIEDARSLVRAQLPALNELVGRQLAVNGYSYGYKVELGTVPFPAKTFGSRVYPAGEYEALRITLGQGNGQNWWCVLFPPLCLSATAEKSNSTAVAASTDSKGKEKQGKLEKQDKQTAEVTKLKADSKKEAHSFFWDKSKQFISWAKHRFA